MADDDMDEQYLDDDLDFDWFYVEDTSPLADELAETSIPDPGYAGTAWELDESWMDFDLYEYWGDLEYGNDTYWDSAGTGEKRKRGDATRQPAGKRRKLSLKETGGHTSMYVSMAERCKLWSQRPPIKKELKSFALLPDWRKRCAKADSAPSAKAMPEEMRQAAEGKDEDTPEGARHFDAEAMDGEEGDWEDEDEEGEAGDLQAQLANLDPEMLKTILRQKLGDAGLEGMDEGAFMQTISQMLSGEGGADDAAGELANNLLGQATQGENTALSGWLSGQGVSLDQAEDEDDGDSVATAELPPSQSSSRKGKGKKAQVSPTDSAIEINKHRKTAEMAMHDGSPKAAKKRLAPTVEGEDGTAKKRKVVTFDVPASQESAQAPTDAAGNQLDSSEDPLASEPTVAPADDVSTSEDPIASEPTVTSKSTRGTAKAEATPAPVPAKTRATKAQNTQPEPPASAPAKSSRKRKAQAEAEEEPPPPKKQTRTTASKKGGDEGPSYARATRATRARSGK